MNTTEQAITDVVETYFKGTFEGNADNLISCFHPKAHITGHFDDINIDLARDAFIERVKQQKIDGINQIYDKSILSLEHQHNIAIVKARVRVGNDVFIDYISLMLFGNEWKIRHKLFTNRAV
jgi:hypothetical protein